MPLMRASLAVKAVSKTMGICRCSSLPLSLAQSSKPVIPGIITSSRIIATSLVTTISSATVFVILHNEDFHRHRCLSPLYRNGKSESTALAILTVNPDHAAVKFQELLCYSEP